MVRDGVKQRVLSMRSIVVDDSPTINQRLLSLRKLLHY